MKTQQTQLQLVTFEQAKRLKKLGFDWKCGSCYDTQGKAWDLVGNIHSITYPDISAPTVALALKWAEDEKKIKSGLSPAHVSGTIRYIWWYSVNGGIDSASDGKEKEAAESDLLDEVLTILEEKQWNSLN
jgi:hypothetical protein